MGDPWRRSGMTSSVVDLADRAHQRDPYPAYAWLREHEPVHWSARLKMWVVTRYEDVHRILHDPVRYSSDRFRRIPSALASRRPDIEDVARVLRDWAVFRDPPDHTRLRGLLNKAFTPRRIETMAPRIQRIVDHLLDAIAERREMDVIADLAFPLPATVIAALLGVPTGDLPRMKTWSDQIAAYVGGAQAGGDTIDEAGRGLAAIVEYFRRLIHTRSGDGDDLVSLMLAAEDRGEMFTREEVVSNCVLLLFAGHETTTNLLGNGLVHLLRHPQQVELLRADPGLMPAAVEELLRYDPPVAGKIKIAAEDVALHGRDIRNGDLVAIMIAAANRDPHRFERPDTLDVTRESIPHLAFGYGIHFCLGAALARLEAQIALTTLLRRCRELTLLDEAPRWKPQIFFRGLEALPVAFR
jgi:cytochrome P450